MVGVDDLRPQPLHVLTKVLGDGGCAVLAAVSLDVRGRPRQLDRVHVQPSVVVIAGHDPARISPGGPLGGEDMDLVAAAQQLEAGIARHHLGAGVMPRHELVDDVQDAHGTSGPGHRHNCGGRRRRNREAGGVPASEAGRLVLAGQRLAELLPPTLPQVGDFIRRRGFAREAADERHVGRVDVSQAALAQAQGEVDVVERARQARRLEAAHGFEPVARDHHAVGANDRRVERAIVPPRGMVGVGDPLGWSLRERVQVDRPAALAKPAVAVHQPAAHPPTPRRSACASSSPIHASPAALGEAALAVAKQQVFAGRPRHREVRGAGGRGAVHRLEAVCRFRWAADDDHLVDPLAVRELVEDLGLGRGGGKADDRGNRRDVAGPAADEKRAVGVRPHRAILAAAGEGRLCCLGRPHGGIGAVRQSAAVVEDPRQVPNVLRSLGYAQQKVMLGPPIRAGADPPAASIARRRITQRRPT